MKRILYLTGCEFGDTYRTQLETKYLSKYFHVKSVGVINRSKELYFRKSKNLDIITIENKLDYSYFFFFLFTLLFKLILKNKISFLMRYLLITFVFLILEFFYLIIYPTYVAIKIKKNFLINKFIYFFRIFFFLRSSLPNKKNKYAQPNTITKWLFWLPTNKVEKNKINEYEKVPIYTFFNFIRIKLRRNFLLLIYCLKKKIDFEIISVKDFDGLVCASIFKILNNCKFIYNSYEFFPFEWSGTNKFQKNVLIALEKLFINSPDQIVCVSRSMIKLFKNYYHQEKIIDIPNVDLLSKIPKMKRKTQSINFIYQGGIAPYRGVVSLVKNWPTNNHYKLTIRSSENLYFQKLREYCLNKDLRNIQFIKIKKNKESLNQSLKFLLNFDVGVVSFSNKCDNYQIASPRKFSHYIQSELPILTSDIEDLKHIVIKYKIGKVYKTDSKIDFQRVLKKFNLKTLKNYKENTRNFKKKYYNFGNFIKIYQKIYNEN